MSIKLMTLVWEKGPTKPTDRFVLLALADNANDEGMAWPSIATIVRKTQLSERSVQGSIKRLHKAGWLDIEAGNGRKNTNLYIIKNPAGAAPPQDMPPADYDINPADGAGNPAGAAPKPSRTIKEPSIDNICAKKNALDGFEDFWDIYAYKKARPKCEAIWKRKNLTAISRQVIDGARRYAESRGAESRYWKHPQGWLNDARWTDEPDAPSQQNHQPRQSETMQQRLRRQAKDRLSKDENERNVIDVTPTNIKIAN